MIDLERDFEVALFRQPQGVINCIRMVRKERKHFLPGFYVELIAGILHPFGVGQHPSGLDAEQGIMGFPVGFQDVVGIIGGDQRQIEFLR